MDLSHVVLPAVTHVFEGKATKKEFIFSPVYPYSWRTCINGIRLSLARVWTIINRFKYAVSRIELLVYISILK